MERALKTWAGHPAQVSQGLETTWQDSNATSSSGTTHVDKGEFLRKPQPEQ
jgi:hypothetical protein